MTLAQNIEPTFNKILDMGHHLSIILVPMYCQAGACEKQKIDLLCLQFNLFNRMNFCFVGN